MKGAAMKILVAGSTGLVGKALSLSLEKNYEVIKLVRKNKKLDVNEFFWDPENGELSKDALEGVYAIVNLSGETISSYWTQSKKQKILSSRVVPTALLVNKALEQKDPPKIFINASATGYIGAKTDEVIFHPSEEPFRGFLSQVCDSWENAMKPAYNKNIRCLALRFGAILSKNGGALKSMMPAFKMGVGGCIGSGKQLMSWIAIDDVVNAIKHVLENDNCHGAYDFVSPIKVTNEEFTKKLGGVLNRPTFMSMPAFLVRILFGQLADEILLNSSDAKPRRLLESGYKFLYPDLEKALQHILK